MHLLCMDRHYNIFIKEAAFEMESVGHLFIKHKMVQYNVFTIS